MAMKVEEGLVALAEDSAVAVQTAAVVAQERVAASAHTSSPSCL